MSRAPTRRESPALRLSAFARDAAAVEAVPDVALLATVPRALRSYLEHSRLRHRLEQRFLRRVGADVAPGALGREPVAGLLSGSETEIDRLALRAGLFCHADAVRRLVHRRDQLGLGEAMDMEFAACLAEGEGGPGEVRLRAQLRLVPHDAGLDSLLEAILHDGALCWAAWIGERGEVEARALRLATPTPLRRRIANFGGPRPRSEMKARALIAGTKLARKPDGGSFSNDPTQDGMG